MRIALLEDDEHQAEIVRLWLEAAGNDIQHFATGQSFIAGISHESFDLFIIDWMLPDTDGLSVLKWVREQKHDRVPVLFVTQRESEEDIVQALEYGADDYMIKPVKQMELLARLNALVRRASSGGSTDSELTFGEYKVDSSSRHITFAGDHIDLTNKEFELALFLFRNIGRVLSRGHILETVWGRSPKVNTRTVDTHVSRLRNKLQLYPERGWKLTAIYQHGYRLEQASPSSDVSTNAAAMH